MAALVGAPGAAAQAAGERAAAKGALETAMDALAATNAPGPPDRTATLALRDLAAALPALDGADRRRAETLLARPTEGAADPIGAGYAPGTEVRHAASPQGSFCVTWVTTGQDAPPDAGAAGVPTYVRAIQRIAERAHRIEVEQLGWRPPLADTVEECDAPDQIDIYLKDVGWSGFGYQATDPGQSGRERYGYLVIDNDYRRAQFPEFAEPLDAARVTIAHELNHLSQIAISFHQESWMFESTATWIEERVFPAVDDYLYYVGFFAESPHVPLTSPTLRWELKIYGAAVWQHWLAGGEGGFGDAVVPSAWEASEATSPEGFPLVLDHGIRAFDSAIADLGGTGFVREFVAFAAATAEWRTGDGGFPDARRYPNVRRSGLLEPGRGERRFRIDHSAYRLLRVPAVGGSRLSLRVAAPKGLRAGLALVARRGSATGGAVVRRVQPLRAGGRGMVSLANPGRYERITAVLVNADGRISGQRMRSGSPEWTYSRDDQPFTARLRVSR